jgi:hypothetical protein
MGVSAPLGSGAASGGASVGAPNKTINVHSGAESADDRRLCAEGATQRLARRVQDHRIESGCLPSEISPQMAQTKAERVPCCFWRESDVFWSGRDSARMVFQAMVFASDRSDGPRCLT